MRLNALVRFPQSVMPVARPAILRGIIRHVCAYRVQFDVAHAGQQVILGLYHARFESAFPQATGAVVAAVDVLHIASADGLHQFGDAARHRDGHAGGIHQKPIKVDEFMLAINSAIEYARGKSPQFS